MKNKMIMIAALVAAAGTSVAATNQLQLDINSLGAQAVDSGGANVAFGGLTHTGAVLLSHTGTTALSDILLNGVDQNITPGQLLSFSGQIDLVSGGVTGGSFTLTLTDLSTFTADIVAGQGSVILQGPGYSISGLIANVLFSSDPFAGVIITPWFSNQPLSGSFIEFAYNPDGAGYDSNTNLDVFVNVPNPLAGGMAGIGLMGLAARRRR